MKKYRPLTAGYIVLYILVVLCVGDAIYALLRNYVLPKSEVQTMMGSMDVFSYIIAAIAIVYARIYIQARVEIGEQNMRIVCPFYLRPKEGQKRAFFIYRQGDCDMKLINKTFNLKELEKFGYIEDLGYSRLDNSGADENSPLFPVHEVALVLTNGKRYHLNAGHYKPETLKEMVAHIEKVSGVKVTGKLADPVAAEQKRREDRKNAKNGKTGKKKK